MNKKILIVLVLAVIFIIAIVLAFYDSADQGTGMPYLPPPTSPTVGGGSCYSEDGLITLFSKTVQTPHKIVFADIDKFDTSRLDIVVHDEFITVFNEGQNIDETKYAGGGAGFVFDSDDVSPYAEQQIEELPQGYMLDLSVRISPCHTLSAGDPVGTLYAYGAGGQTLIDGVKITTEPIQSYTPDTTQWAHVAIDLGCSTSSEDCSTAHQVKYQVKEGKEITLGKLLIKNINSESEIYSFFFYLSTEQNPRLTIGDAMSSGQEFTYEFDSVTAREGEIIALFFNFYGYVENNEHIADLFLFDEHNNALIDGIEIRG